MDSQDRLTKDEKKLIRKQEWQDQLDREKQKKLFTKITWWVGGIVVLGGTLWILILSSGPSPTTSSTVAIPPIAKADMTQGPDNARVTLVEYADFQCPACGAWHPVLKPLLASYKGKVRFVYRYFPLSNIHKNAKLSAQAAYAASKQGKFWEMHDMLFETQKDWSEAVDPTETFVSYAQKLGIDTDIFKKDMSADATVKYITDAEDTAGNIGINSTPTFFLNGHQLVNLAGPDALKQAIDQQLAKST